MGKFYLCQDGEKTLKLRFFISLDIFLKKHQNGDISTELDAWLTFLSTEEPDEIMRLCDAFLFFRDIYRHIYEICQNTEDVMGIFSEALAELDRNTVDYMIDKLKRSNEQLQVENEQLQVENERLQGEKERLQAEMEQLQDQITQRQEELDSMRK